MARRLEGGTARLRYNLLDAGRAYLRYTERTGDREDGGAEESDVHDSGDVAPLPPRMGKGT